MRKLATVAEIEDVQPIPEADKIVKVRVRGWWCVALKDEFKKGDLAVFFEVDSFLPDVPQFEFLKKGHHLNKMIVDGQEREGHQLKTVILRKQLSQGLALPVSQFPEATGHVAGDDLTETLGVRLYEPPLDASLSGVALGPRPGTVPRTDEERIQNGLTWLDEYRGRKFVVTSKIDGTSMSVYSWQKHFGVCGRELEWTDTPTNTYWNVARGHDLQSKMPEGYAVQGELAGEGIQGNRMTVKGQEMYVFRVWDISRGEFLDWSDTEKFSKDLDLPTVPVVFRDLVLDHTLEQLLALADGPCPINPRTPREGLVFALDAPGNRVSFKVISNAYLARYGL